MKSRLSLSARSPLNNFLSLVKQWYDLETLSQLRWYFFLRSLTIIQIGWSRQIIFGCRSRQFGEHLSFSVERSGGKDLWVGKGVGLLQEWEFLK
jgi:hypothetical protein